MTERDTYPLIINSSDIVANSGNSQFRYRFPSGAAYFKNCKLALSNIAMYYSWYNITAKYGNNTFSYRWYNNAGSSVFDVTIPDGYYSVSDLNSFLQNTFILNGHYLIDDLGNYRYYITLDENPTYYSVEVTCYPIPTSLPLNWTNPAGMTFPLVASTPLFIVGATNFRNLIGFDSGSFPSVTQSTIYSKLSDFTPQLSTVQTLIVLVEILDNFYSNPKTVLYSFTPSDIAFGAAFSSQPNQLTFVKVVDGNYSDILIRIVDQNYNDVTFQDPNILIQLIVETPTKSLSY